DSFGFHNVEFRFSEWRGHFVFYNLDPGAVTGDDAIGLFDCADTANIDTNAGVKFQRLAARCRLRIPKHDADFFTNLVGKNTASPRLRDQGSEFAQRGAHQSRLRDHGQRKGGFAGRLRTENFDHTTAGKTADAKRTINQNVPGRNNVDINYLFVTKTHDGAIAVILGDLLNGEIEIFVTGGGDLVFAGLLSGFSGHNSTVN